MRIGLGLDIGMAVPLSGGIKYLLRDQFSITRAAGSVNGTLAEPGPGTRTVTDSGNNLSITGGRAVSDGIVGAGDPRLGYSDAIARSAGRTFKWTIQYVNARGHSGIAMSATPTDIIYGIFEGSGILSSTPPTTVYYQVADSGADYTVWITLFASAGAAIWLQGGTGSYLYTNPTLIWVTSRFNDDPVYVFPQIARAIACQIQNDDVEVIDIPSLGSRQLLATVYKASPAHGVNYTTVANAIHALSFNLPGSPSGGDKISLHYRQQDATNYFEAYVKRNVGNTAWDFLLDRVDAGSPTNLITVTGVGSPDRIIVVVHGNEHWCFTEANDIATIRGTKQTDANFNTDTEVGAWFDAGTMNLLESFARTWNL